jgi:release factor glutamine methyltransferase
MSVAIAGELERAAAFLAAHGVGSARLEAEVLLADALGADRARLYVQRDVPDAVVARFAELLERRGRGEPLQHLRGKQEFFSRDFAVDPRVLIPRPETELLVETALRSIAAIERPAVLDVGTGAGAIAITLALERPDARVCATDVSEEALAVARANAHRLGADRVALRQGDLIDPFAAERFDLVVSNPPYVPSAEIDTLAAEVRLHEPRIALDGGRDGLEAYRRLDGCIDRVLVSGGLLAVEIGFGQLDAVREILARGGRRCVAVERDLGGIDRVVVVGRG